MGHPAQRPATAARTPTGVSPYRWTATGVSLHRWTATGVSPYRWTATGVSPYRWTPTGVSLYRWTATGVSLTACGASCSETSHCSSDAFGSCFSENLLSSEMATVSAADTLAADDSVECVTDLTRGEHSQSEAPASSPGVRNVI